MNGVPYTQPNFTISNRPALTSDWTSREANPRRISRVLPRDIMEGVSGEGQPTSGPDPEEHRQRYEASGIAGAYGINYGARGALAGLVEAVRCALGISKDRCFIGYVFKQKQKIIERAERLFTGVMNDG